MISKAAQICAAADIFILIGSSLAVYPAAGLIDYVPQDTPKYIIDLKIPYLNQGDMFIKVEEKATTGVSKVVDDLLSVTK